MAPEVDASARRVGAARAVVRPAATLADRQVDAVVALRRVAVVANSKDDVCLVLLNKKADERSGSAAADRSSTAALGDEVRKRSLSAFYL